MAHAPTSKVRAPKLCYIKNESPRGLSMMNTGEEISFFGSLDRRKMPFRRAFKICYGVP